jgi:probable rRNA maturation factor
MPETGEASPVSSTAEPSADAEPPQRLSVTILVEDGDWSGFGKIERIVCCAAAALASDPRLVIEPASDASVVLASDALMRRLNRTYRGKDAATNVLSFPFRTPPGAVSQESTHLGDVVLAAETVGREAAERGIEPSHHLQHLVVHGLLHLLGYDHQTDSEAEAMENLETEILARIGVADPYASAALT